MLHGACVGEEAGVWNLAFFRVKSQPAIKGTSCVRRLRLRSLWFLLCVLQRVVVPVCVVLFVSWSCGCRSHWNGCMNVAWAMFWGGSRSTKPCVFPCKVAAAGDERYLVRFVRRLRLVVPVCVVLCVSWSCGCRSHWNGCMNVAWAMFRGGSRSTKPCVFPFKVAAAGDERYLVCAAVAAAVVVVPSMCFATGGCSCVRSSMRFLKLWLQIALEWLHDCRHLMLPRA